MAFGFGGELPRAQVPDRGSLRHSRISNLPRSGDAAYCSGSIDPPP